MICTQCKQEVNDGAKFCNHCGAPTDNVSLPASWGKRFLNQFLDQIFIQIIAGAIIFGGAYLNGGFGDNPIMGIWLGLGTISLYILYYLILEACFGTTLGKLITGTKVVNKEGNKPRFLQILGRTFARYIPLEPLSYIFGRYPIGWHDMLSGTYVVSKTMTPEQIRAIDPKVVGGHKSSTAWIIAIVIIIVIMIIGILSSVVLASLSHARSKADEAGKQAQVNSLRATSLLYQTKNNSYTGFCKTKDVTALHKYDTDTAVYSCNDSDTAWAVSVPVENKFGCVDSTGTEPTLSAASLGDKLACPQVGTWTSTTARDGSFTVEFPGDAANETVEGVKADETDPSITYTSDLYKVVGAESSFILIEHAYNKPFTAEERKTLLPGYANYFAEVVKGTIVDQTTLVDENGIGDADFIINTTDGKEKVQGKIFLTKDKAYMLIVTSDSARQTDSGFAHFVESFKLVK